VRNTLTKVRYEPSNQIVTCVLFVCTAPHSTCPLRRSLTRVAQSMRPFITAQRARTGSSVGSTYSLPLSTLSDDDLVRQKTRLTLQARCVYGTAPPPFEAWFVHEARLHVPRFYGLEQFGPAETDVRVLGDAIDVSFVGELTDVQQRATSAVFANELSPQGDGGVMISLPCGYGKTVWAVHTIATLGRKACVLVHKAFLRDQWVHTFATFCPDIRIGHIQGKVCDIENCDVVIAMVMTVAKRECNMDSFGTVCFDECHHMAAPVMNLATRKFRARYVIGLTATKDRPDGLTPLLHWSLGSEAFRVERDAEAVRVSIALFSPSTSLSSNEILGRDGKPIVSIMITRLAQNVARNQFIARRVVAMRAQGRVVLVLSDRIAQLHTLRSMIVSGGVDASDVGLFTGATKKQMTRNEQLAKPVVLCSYGMANEGLDKREADTCVMATPKSRVTQCIGRIQRPCATKKQPLVLDVVDHDTSVFTQLRWKRQQLYAKEKYEIQVVQVDAASELDWFV